LNPRPSFKEEKADLRVSEFSIPPRWPGVAREPQFFQFTLPREWNLKNLDTIFQISVSPYPKGKNKGSFLKATREGTTERKKIPETKVSEFFKFH
jgi:hypothetical protein